MLMLKESTKLAQKILSHTKWDWPKKNSQVSYQCDPAGQQGGPWLTAGQEGGPWLTAEQKGGPWITAGQEKQPWSLLG